MSNTPPQEPGEYKPPPAPATIAGQWTPQPPPGQAHPQPPAGGAGGGYPPPPPAPPGGGGGGGGFPPPPGGGAPPPPPPPPGGGFPPPPSAPPAYGQPQGYGQQPQYGQPQPYAGSGPVDVQGRPVAEWWKRAVAAIIDNVILSIPIWILYAILIGSATAASNSIEVDPVTGEITGGGAAAAGIGAGFLIYWFVSLVLPLAYFAVLNGGAKGQTVGKMVMKIAVRSEETGGPIGIGKGFLRYFVLLLMAIPCGIPLLINWLSPLWDPKRQAWHDKVAKTNVVEVG